MKTKTRRSREKNIIFNVTQEEKDRIIELAIEHDMSISDYCRKTLLGKELEKNDV